MEKLQSFMDAITENAEQSYNNLADSIYQFQKI